MNRLSLLLLTLCICCSDLKEYKIRLKNIHRLDVGMPIYVLGHKVGRLESLKLDHNNTLLTIEIDNYIRVTEDSRALLHEELLGGRTIELVLGNSSKLIDKDQILIGEVAPLDTTLMRAISEHEFDSLLRAHPDYKVVEPIYNVMRRVSENKKRQGTNQ